MRLPLLTIPILFCLHSCVPSPGGYDHTFDTSIVNDQTIPVVAWQDTIPHSPVTNSELVCKHDAYIDLGILDSACYSAANKVKFLREILEDNYDFNIEQFFRNRISFLIKNRDALQMMINWLKQTPIGDAHHPMVRFYLLYDLPGSDIIVQKCLDIAPPNGTVMHWLVTKGKYEQAYQLLAASVNKSLADSSEPYLMEEPFHELCFVPDEKVRTATRQLVVKAVNSAWYVRLFPLALYLDEQGTLPAFRRWYNYYADASFMHVNAYDYLYFMSEAAAPYMGRRDGKNFWEYYTCGDSVLSQFLPHDETSGLLYVLKYCLQDPKLSADDKKHMLSALTPRDQLLQRQAYTPGKEYDLSQMLADANKLGGKQINAKEELEGRSAFEHTQLSYEENVYGFFSKAITVKGFQDQRARGAIDYPDIFRRQLNPLLIEQGINDISIHQVTEPVGDAYKYQLYISSHEGAYQLTFEEAYTGVTNTRRIVKMINLLLMKKQTKLRLVNIDMHSDRLLYGVCEPGLAKPYADKYKLTLYAVEPIRKR